MLVQFTVYPSDATHMSRDVALMVQVLERAGLDFRLGPMATAVEGTWEQVMPAIRRCHEIMREHHARVITTITVDDRAEQAHHLDEMVSVVEQHLGHATKRAGEKHFISDAR
jgi:uncharacterized protein (TIGR00106 family)